MTGETMTVVGEQEGEVTVGVLVPSCRVNVETYAIDGLTFEEPEHVDLFIGWLREARDLARRLRPEREGAPG